MADDTVCQDLENALAEAERFSKLGQKDDAILSFSKFITACSTAIQDDKSGRIKSVWNDSLCAAYNSRGHLNYLLVEFKHAVEDFSKAIALNESFAEAYYNRGLIHYRLGRFDEAIVDMTDALARDPHVALRSSAEQCMLQAKADRVAQQQKLRAGSAAKT